MRPRLHKVTLELNQQQYELLEFLRKEGKLGESDEAIVKSVLKKALKEKFN